MSVLTRVSHARTGGLGFGIANYPTSSADGKELRQNLYAAAKKPMRTVLRRKRSILKVRVFESFCEDAFEVTMGPGPGLDRSVAQSFTAKQGQ
jgi:hypothetical protein